MAALVAGTDASLASEAPTEISRHLVPIEEVQLGSRVPTTNPDWTDTSAPQDFRDPSQWQVVALEFHHHNGTVVDLELLRPREWVRQNKLAPGSSLNLNFPEIDVLGSGTVQRVSPCLVIDQGPGSVVTGRVKTRLVSTLVQVTLADGETLTGTASHRIWSVTRDDWVELGELISGEHLRGEDGTWQVAATNLVHEPQPVYNLEIDAQHVYQVTGHQLLVHNNDEACQELFRLLVRTENGKNATPEELTELHRLAETVGRTTDDLPPLSAPRKGTHPLFPDSTQIEYGEGLSAIARRRRLAGGVKDGQNVAVVEYVHEGVTKTKLFKSVKTPEGSLHSEDVAAIWLKKQGVDPNNVKRLYSEFHPCVRCDPNVRAAFPRADIEFTWPYKSVRDPISKIGRDAKMDGIRRLRGE